MVSRTCGRPRRVPGRISAGPSGSTPSRSTSPLGDLDKLSEPPQLSANPTPAPEAPPAPEASPAPPIAKYTEEDLQRILKTVLEAQVPAPAPTISFPEGPRERPLKAWFPEVYTGENHMDCYNFCQQCEDHFATAGAKGPNRIPFAASFLRDRINFRWQQHKRKLDAKSLAPITWDEFKAFLRRSLGDSRAFIDSFWRKMRRDSQYQQEDVQDWAAHLEHLQAVLKEFDPVVAPSEDVLICYFRDGLRPSIRAQMDSRNRELDSWEEVLEKAIEAESKASLQSASNTRDMDARCFRGRRPAKKDEVSFFKDPRIEELNSDSQEPKSSPSLQPSRSKSAETSEKKTRKEKKQQRRKDQERVQKDSETPSTSGQARRNLADVTCFNCDKKEYYATKCLERDTPED